MFRTVLQSSKVGVIKGAKISVFGGIPAACYMSGCAEGYRLDGEENMQATLEQLENCVLMSLPACPLVGGGVGAFWAGITGTRLHTRRIIRPNPIAIVAIPLACWSAYVLGISHACKSRF